jgi:aminopeptidase N
LNYYHLCISCNSWPIYANQDNLRLLILILHQSHFLGLIILVSNKLITFLCLKPSSMKPIIISKFAIASIILLACHSNKKTVAATSSPTSPPSPAIVLADTPKVEKNTPPVLEVYRASNPMVCDLVHTKLEVDFDWTYSRLNGKATIELKPHFYATNMCYLNARGMDIKSVKLFEYQFTNETETIKGKKVPVANQKLFPAQSTFKYENDSIKINLGRAFTNKENFIIEIVYVAKPDELKEGGSNAISSDKGLYFINPKSLVPYKMPQIWTQGETQSSSAWFPTIDSPNQKTTQEIYMTVLDRFTTLSNGILVDSKKNTDGTRTDHWKMDQPHAPYLAMMAVGQFTKIVDEPWNGKEISYYVEAEYAVHAKAIFGNTKEMIEFYSNKLGVPYAWPKYAQIVVRDYVSGAMENTSATLHGDFAVYATTREIQDGNKGEDIIAHELFHQWFGDLVTCESWSNLPLNESFATYGEYLWLEHKFGRDAADQHHMQSRGGYMASKKQVNMIRFNYEDREDMFDGFSYSKGGQILHMLRKAVGDDAFFASLKKYLENRKFKTAEIHDLRLAFEEVTGKDMNWFFNQWFMAKGHPVIEISNNFNSADNLVEFTIEQKQDFKIAPLYELPLEIDVYENGKVTRHHIVVKEAKQTFKFKTSGKPSLVNFDAERQLLAEVTYKKSTEEYVFQYNNAPLFSDRAEALKELSKDLKNEMAYNTIKLAAEKDKFYRLRQTAITNLNSIAKEKESDLKPLMLSIYNKDTKSTTRSYALEFLNTHYDSAPELVALNEKALGEPSYAIDTEALEFFAKKDPKTILQKAKPFEVDAGKTILYTLSRIYGEHGLDNEITFFTTNIKHFGGFELIGYLGNYIKLAKRVEGSVPAIIAARDFEIVARDGGRFTKNGAIKGLKDLVTIWTKKETDMKAKIEGTKKESKDVTALEKELKTITETKDIIAGLLKGVS